MNDPTLQLEDHLKKIGDLEF